MELKTLALFFLICIIVQFFNCSTFLIDQKEEDEDQNQDIDKSVILNVGDEGNHTLDHPLETPSAETGIGGTERLTLEKNEDNDEAEDEV